MSNDRRPNRHFDRDSGHDPDPWIDLADRVSSGEEIDFVALEAEINDPAARELLRAFGTLASIHQLHSGHHLEASRVAPVPRDATAESSTAPAGESWGGLELRASLGRGASGEVRRAYDPRLQREVALKLLHPHRVADREWADAMLREGRALARVDHPHVVRVLGAEEHDDQWGMWMELVQGKSLAELVTQQGRFSAHEAALMGERVARALSAVHTAGIVHRDVKAQNVMREDGGRVVLMDFGSSRKVDAQADPGVSGTPFYLAPELFDGAAATTKSDIYSVGVLLYYLVSGQFPLSARSYSELGDAHARGEHRSLREVRPDLPSGFIEVVETALAIEPDQRFSSAGRLADALARVSGAGWSVEAAPVPAERRRTSWALPLVALVLVAVAWGGWSFVGVSTSEFEVDAALLRYGDHSVEELYSGATLSLEQDLGLRFRATEEVYLYVINQDAAGESFVLFPLRGGELQNPLPGGASYELPGRVDGEDVAWTVTSSGGQEQILMVASQVPLPTLEARLAAVAQARGSSPYTPIDAPVLEGLRGIGGLSSRLSADSAAPGENILDEFEELARASARFMQSKQGVWVRRIVLQNGGS
jgi:Protein kinase domain/Domain of unknown function (DUF4384)